MAHVQQHSHDEPTQLELMGIKIPLPEVRRKPNSTAHPYPIQIAFQTQQLLQAAVFYAALADTAAGQRINQPGAREAIEKELLDNGLDQKAMNKSWIYLIQYKDLFLNYVTQNVPIIMKSHWDWYIRNLGRFVEFARGYSSGRALSSEAQKQLTHLGKREMPLSAQLETLRNSTDLELSIDLPAIEAFEEMSLVRNLGLHNRWEIDGTYLTKSTRPNKGSEGELRLVNLHELAEWRSAVDRLILATWSPIAELYANAPDYPE